MSRCSAAYTMHMTCVCVFGSDRFYHNKINLNILYFLNKYCVVVPAEMVSGMCLKFSVL